MSETQIILFLQGGSKDKAIARGCGKYLSDNYEVFILPQFKPADVIRDNSFIISFGKATYRIVQSDINKLKYTSCRHLCAPLCSKLYPEDTNKETRQEWFEKLQEIKDTLQSKEEQFNLLDLPLITTQQALSLANTLLNKGEKIQLTNDKGELIEITQEKNDNSKADYSFTAGELVVIKLLQDLLKVREIKIEKENK